MDYLLFNKIKSSRVISKQFIGFKKDKKKGKDNL